MVTVKTYLLLMLIVAIAIPGAVAVVRDLQSDRASRRARVATRRAGGAKEKANRRVARSDEMRARSVGRG